MLGDVVPRVRVAPCDDAGVGEDDIQICDGVSIPRSSVIEMDVPCPSLTKAVALGDLLSQLVTSQLESAISGQNVTLFLRPEPESDGGACHGACRMCVTLHESSEPHHVGSWIFKNG